MQEKKKSFVLYTSYKRHLELLNNEERGQLIMALFDYIEDKTDPNLEGAALMAFSFITSQMDMDAAKYAKTVEKRRESGKKGGRPKANASEEKAKKANGFSEKQSEAKKPDNDNVNDDDNVNVNDNDNDINNTTPYIPQGGAPNGAPKAEPVPYKDIVELYHDICKSYPTLRNVSENRKKAIAARWKEYEQNLEIFRELFTMAEASPFLKGKNDRNWRADFNWLMNSENMAKVLEGNYNSSNNNGGQTNGDHNRYDSRHGSQSFGREATGSQTAGRGTTLSGFRMAD